MLLIDAANVIGSRPNGWWRDRAGAARGFVDQLREAVRTGRLVEPVLVVLEGAARDGVEERVADDVTVVHASGSGDDKLIEIATEADAQVVLVSADRDLLRRAKVAGAKTASPRWLLDTVLS